MRKIKKTVKVTVFKCKVYNTTSKSEEEMEITTPDKVPPLPVNCVLINSEVVETKELVYTMTPEVFVKYATVEEA